MATVQQVRNIAPFVDKEFVVTSPWWTERVNPVTGETEIHKGLDITTHDNDPVYSMLNGRVIALGTTSSAGNYIIIADDNPQSGYFGFATRYLHLKELPNFQVGDRISRLQIVGIEGSTGQSTAIHLHVEMQNVYIHNWIWTPSNNKTDYIDPTLFMGIDNVYLTHWIYHPDSPVPTISKYKKFNWAIMKNKIMNRRFTLFYKK